MIFVKRQLSNGDVPLLEPISAATSPITDMAVHEPVAATKATVTVAAVLGVRHVCAGISAAIAAAATPQTPVHIRLIDGASGGASLLWSMVLSAPANTADWIEMTGLGIQGSINTAMTLEFEAAPVAGAFETVALHSYDYSETTK